ARNACWLPSADDRALQHRGRLRGWAERVPAHHRVHRLLHEDVMTEDKPDSALPEKFEVFEQRMLEAEKFKRRRSTPAVKPKNMPEPEKKKRLTAADVPGVGGMVEKRWSGLPMWECSKC